MLTFSEIIQVWSRREEIIQIDSDKGYMVPRCSTYDVMHHIKKAKHYNDEDVEERRQAKSWGIW